MMILFDEEPCLDVEAGMVEASNQMENQDAFLPLAEKWHHHQAARALESSA
jgi:hypothetical protein